MAVAAAAAIAGEMTDFRSRTVSRPGSIMTMAPKTLGAEAQVPAMVVEIVKGDAARPAKAGEEGEYTPAPEIEFINETFSSDLFKTGEIGDPDVETDLIDPDYLSLPHPAWYNLLPEAFNGVIWGGHNLFPAGGMGCLVNNKRFKMTAANITIPLVDASGEGYEGIVHVSFKARLEEGKEDGYVVIEAAETNDMSATWDILGSGYKEVTEEWQTYHASFYGGGKTTLINIFNDSGKSVYIDDLRVYQVGQPAQTPIAKKYSDYKGATFTANWDAAKGAEGYELDVYSIDKQYEYYEGQIILVRADTAYLHQALPVNATHFDVTGANPGLKYYYRVRSVKGDFKSLYSNVIEVNELLPTTMHKVTDLGDCTYTASWDEIAGAEAYNYWARFERTAKEDGEFVVTDEDFKDVVDAEGNKTGLTKDNPIDGSYNVIYYSGRKQPGWRGLNSYPYTDYIAVDAWQYIFNGTDAGYVSPEFDMSKDEGKFTVSVDVAANRYTGDDGEGHQVSGYPRCAIAIFNFDESLGDYKQTEIFIDQNVKFNWKNFTVNCETGSKRTVIGIYGIYAPENLYIDNLKVTQNYKKDEMLLDCFWFSRFLFDNTVEVKVPWFATNTKLYHQVCGTRSEVVETSLMGEVKFLESPYCPLELVAGSDAEKWSGVDTPRLTSATVQPVGDNTIVVYNPEAEEVTVVDLAGRAVYTNASGAERQTVALPAPGVYVVKVGGKTVKLHL